ncbi:MAG: PIN domain nuclease [Proteobacteria bacterium]|nr:PIN domain nuclease [Pseudomonadota bacterium]
MILVDSSVWIDHFRGDRTLQTDYLALCLAEANVVVLSGLVVTEILQGMRDDAQAEPVKAHLARLEMAPELGRSDYEAAATIYRTCRVRGFTPRSTIDCLIAQQCLREGYTLLACDRDFSVIARFFPLRLVESGHEIHEGGARGRPDGPAGRAPGSPLSRQSASAARLSSRASVTRRRAIRR